MLPKQHDRDHPFVNPIPPPEISVPDDMDIPSEVPSKQYLMRKRPSKSFVPADFP